MAIIRRIRSKNEARKIVKILAKHGITGITDDMLWNENYFIAINGCDQIICVHHVKKGIIYARNEQVCQEIEKQLALV